MSILYDLDLDEVSLVDRGANPGAHVLLMKRQPTKQEENQDFPPEAFAYVPDVSKSSTWGLRLWGSLEEKTTSRQVGRTIAALGEDSRVQKMQIPVEDLPEVKQKVLAAWRKVHEEGEPIPEVLKGVNSMSDIENLKKERDDALSMAEELEKALNDAKVKLEEIEKAREEEEKDDVEKAELPENVRKMFEEHEVTIAKQAEAIEKMRDERLTAEWVAKSEKVVGENEATAEILKAIAKVDEGLAEKTYCILKAATEQVEKGGLFDELGGSGDNDNDSAYDQLKKAAEKIREGDSSLTAEQAFAKAYKQNNELRKAYRKEISE